MDDRTSTRFTVKDTNPEAVLNEVEHYLRRKLWPSFSPESNSWRLARDPDQHWLTIHRADSPLHDASLWHNMLAQFIVEDDDQELLRVEVEELEHNGISGKFTCHAPDLHHRCLDIVGRLGAMVMVNRGTELENQTPVPSRDNPDNRPFERWFSDYQSACRRVGGKAITQEDFALALKCSRSTLHRRMTKRDGVRFPEVKERYQRSVIQPETPAEAT